ncbi:DUF4382 domain-containing protein [Candidatus Bathyarchaeota archaeon]|nr:DUF4382 domain-containing protein [Candidatus Bathyarchaeota archaeon]
MENGSRKIGLRMVSGVLVAITIIVAAFASGVTFPGLENNPNLGSEQGRLTVLLKDAPVTLDELWINMTRLEVHKAGQDGEKGAWIPLWDEDTKIEFDLLAYQNDFVLELAEVSIPSGNYTKIRMNVTEAEAVYYLNEDGSLNETTTLKVPSGKIDVITKFEIENYDHVYVLIDMEADWIGISNSNNLRPVLKATISEQPPAETENIDTPTNPGETV